MPLMVRIVSTFVHVQYPSKTVSKKLSINFRKYPAFVQERIVATANGLPGGKSASVLVVDFNDGHTCYGKNTQNITPIASITKLMTAMVVLDANLPLDETIATIPPIWI
jgi:D-alanyl-D-alanine endopeptidase (penicillin-binding protein 7)